MTVDKTVSRNTPTMTFFTAHGGNTNEGRMTINGMAVAAAFNGGGVSSLTYDTNNVEEVSVVVSGGLGETRHGRAGDEPRAAVGRQQVRRTGRSSTRPASWSRGDNLDDYLRGLQTPITLGPGIISSYDVNASFGGPIKRDRLWFFGGYRKFETAQGVRKGSSRNKFALDPAHWDYANDTSIAARRRSGTQHLPGPRAPRRSTPKNRVMFSHEHQMRCEGSTLTPVGRRLPPARRRLDRLGSTTQSPEANTGYFNFPY